MDFTVKPPAEDRWAAFLDALSRGLGAIGQMHQHREEEEMHENRLDAREAANRAFQENLSRFTQGEEGKRQAAALAAGRENTQLEIGSHEKIAGEETASRERLSKAEMEQRGAYERASLGIEGARLNEEKERTRLQEARDEDRAKKDDANRERSAALTVLGSITPDLNAAIQQKKQLEGELSKAGAEQLLGPEQFAAKKAELDGLNTQIAGLQKDIRGVRSKAGYPSSLDDTGATAAKLSPDRQAIFDAAKSAHPDADPAELLKKVQGLPQEQVDSAIRSRPSAETTDNSFLDPNTAQLADSGTAARAADPNATALNDPAAPAPGAPGAPGATSTDMGNTTDQGAGGDELAQAEPQTSEDQISQSDQFAQMQDQLNQSPEGQGVHTTLDRLAQVSNSVQAERLHRQAELQLANQFPDQDPNGYIDWYLQQQQQEPSYT